MPISPEEPTIRIYCCRSCRLSKRDSKGLFHSSPTHPAWHEARYQEGASLNEARNRARRTWRSSSNAVRPESDDDYYKIFFDNPDFDSKEFHELAELIYGRIYPSEK